MQRLHSLLLSGAVTLSHMKYFSSAAASLHLLLRLSSLRCLSTSEETLLTFSCASQLCNCFKMSCMEPVEVALWFLNQLFKHNNFSFFKVLLDFILVILSFSSLILIRYLVLLSTSFNHVVSTICPCHMSCVNEG